VIFLLLLIYHQRAQSNDFWLRAATRTSFLTVRGCSAPHAAVYIGIDLDFKGSRTGSRLARRHQNVVSGEFKSEFAGLSS
jgi:hypothetical protein